VRNVNQIAVLDGDTREILWVWEWYNPNLAEGHRVQVYRMLRYPAEMVEPFLAK
jgi:hypothetical protein